MLAITSVVFIFFSFKVRFEEDMSKLLPSNEKTESGIVFGNLKVKDKIFIQLTGAAPDVLISCADELVDSILVDDSDLANIFYKIGNDDMMGVLYYTLEHLPSFVDTSLYVKFDKAIANIDQTMAKNYEIIMNDESGALTQMVATDPLNFRSL